MRDLNTEKNLAVFAAMVKELTDFECGGVSCKDCPFHMATEDAREKYGTRCGSSAIYEVMKRTGTVQ